LRKIGGLPKRSFLENPTAPESGHLFFGQAWQGVASAFFPTHPTLEDRIRLLSPEWNGEYLASVVRKTPVEEPEKGAESETVAEDAHLSAAARAAAAIGARKREKAKLKESTLLNPSQGYPAANLPYLGVSMLASQLNLAPLMKKSLREEWLVYTQTREGSKALLLEMMRPTSAPTSKLFSATTTQLLLLLDLAMPMLRRMSLGEYYLFLKHCRKELLRAEELDLVGYLLLHVARRRLALCLGVREIVPVVFEDIPAIWAETQVLISMLERSGAPTIAARNSAHLAAWASLGYENPPAPREGLTVLDLVNALEVCEQASPILKKRLLVACGLAASYQGIISEKHMAILRMFADLLGTPVPHLSSRKMD
jgi:hypothetical protein